MRLALSATAIVLFVLLWQLALVRLQAARSRRRTAPRGTADFDQDPGRERRAERRARALLRSCVNEEEWAMYRDLGFLRVWGGATLEEAPGAPHAYLLYPHLPILAYVPQTRALLGEYCVAFPDRTRPYGSPRLPDSDDVLAKWMALTADERGLIADANMHLPGRQIDSRRARRDLARLSHWESERLERSAQSTVA